MRTRTTAVYADRWAGRTMAVVLLPLVCMLPVLFGGSDVWVGTFMLGEGESEASPPLVIPAKLLGGIRVEAQARLGTNVWAAYEVAVLDKDGGALVEIVKDAWAETGTWHEEGQSGTWAERDTDLFWDFRPSGDEPLRIRVSVLETTDSSGADADFVVPVQVRMRAGVVDGRLVVAALVASLVLGLLAWYSAGHGGVPAVVESKPDSDVQGRGILGGPGRLVSIAIAGVADESCPMRVTVTLTVRDANGQDVLALQRDVPVRHRKDEDGDIEDSRFGLHVHVELPARGSYGVRAVAEPDQPMESMKMIVRDGASTRGPVEVISLDTSGAGAPA